jgi:hypothetical protein
MVLIAARGLKPCSRTTWLSSVRQKRRQLGSNVKRAVALRRVHLFAPLTLKVEPQERQVHETRHRTGNAGVKPREVEKTCGGDLTGRWTPRIMLPAFPERCRGTNSMRAHLLDFGLIGGFSPVMPCSGGQPHEGMLDSFARSDS